MSKVYKVYGNCRAYFKAYVNAKNKKASVIIQDVNWG